MSKDNNDKDCMPELKINKLCHACNKDYELNQVSRRMNSEVISNFENCPYCGARNDVWIKIDLSGYTKTSTINDKQAELLEDYREKLLAHKRERLIEIVKANKMDEYKHSVSHEDLIEGYNTAIENVLEIIKQEFKS